LTSLTRTEGRLLQSTLLSLKNENSEDEDEWSHVGGLQHVKESLLHVVVPLLLLPQHQQHERQDNMHPTQKVASYGKLLQAPPGVLLYGPPGCGKTLLMESLARTVARHGIPCLRIAPSTLMRKYVGDTSLQVRALFGLAQKLGAPVIFWMDELDGLFRERSSIDSGGNGNSDQGVSRDLQTEFMQLWSSSSSSVSGGNDQGSGVVVVVGATNRPFDVDAAFLRRLPQRFYVGLPSTVEERAHVLQTLLRGVPTMSGGLNVMHLAHVFSNYSPSDLQQVLQTAAALGPLRESRQQQQQQQPLRPLTTQDVLRAQQHVPPTTYSTAYQQALLHYIQQQQSASAAPMMNAQQQQQQQQQHPPNSPHVNYYEQQQQQQHFDLNHHHDTTESSSTFGDYDDSNDSDDTDDLSF
jgi:SpoVK/Ycf46/Vps4 family AAA+-type ATPase